MAKINARELDPQRYSCIQTEQQELKKTVFQPYYNGEDLPVLPEQVRDPVQRKSRSSLCEVPPLRRTGVFPSGGIST